MIQAIGLTSAPRRRHKPAVDDLTFEARTGSVTVLLGPEGSGKTSALHLLLQLESGRGVALFNGRPVHRIPYLAREVGVLLGDVPGHPARTARGHLEMLAAVAGVPAERADDVLDVVGLSGLADQRLGHFSLGMDRRLGVAAALLADPHTLVLDEPTYRLSPREAGWLQALLRGYAAQGGSVLATCSEPKEAARLADRVVTLEGGRLVADQKVADFQRARLRPRVAVTTPHAERFADRLAAVARSATRVTAPGASPMEVVYEGGNRISVYGSSCAEVGEVAHRHGILVLQLAEEIGDSGDASTPPPLARADGRRPVHAPARPRALVGNPEATSDVSRDDAPRRPSSRDAEPAPASSRAAALQSMAPELSPGPVPEAPADHTATTTAFATVTSSAPRDNPAVALALSRESASPSSTALDPAGNPAFSPSARAAGQQRPAPRPVALPPRLHAVARPGPAAPVRYELRRLFGVRTTWIVIAATVLTALVLAVGIAMAGGTADGSSSASGQPLAPALRLLTGWPAGSLFPLPPAALAAGFFGALAFGQEFRYPALAPARTSVPRRLGMLAAKLLVSAVLALGLFLLTAVVNAAALTLLLGADATGVGTSALGGPESTASELRLQAASVPLLGVGCAWAGLLAAGIFQSTMAGTAAVVAVPSLVAPAVRTLLTGPAGNSLEGFPERVRALRIVLWPSGADSWVPAFLRLATQPVGQALVLSLTVLLCAYLFTSLHGRPQ